MSLDLTDDKSTLAQVKAWCHQATSHYLSQCWPRSLSPYGVTGPQWVNSLAPGGFDYSLKLVNFKLISTINILSIFCEIAIRWMPQHVTDPKSTLVQVMAWCHQATSHYLSQCCHRSMSPYGVTRPLSVNATVLCYQAIKTMINFVVLFSDSIYDDEDRLKPDAKAYSSDTAVLKANHPMMLMVQHNQEDLLAHPLVTALLRHKWRSYGRYVYYFNLSLYCVFVAFLTIYIVQAKAPYTYRTE